jgi:CRP-like cAMP-binding protein
LARPPQFDGLNDVDAATARRRFRVLQVDAGVPLAEEGSIGRSMMCLVEGELDIHAGGSLLTVVKPGSLLGETALFEDVHRTATVTARTPAVVWALDRVGYEELRDTLHPICRNLETAAIAEQVVRLHGVGDRVAELSLGTPAGLPPTGFFAAVRRLLGVGGERTATGDLRRCLARSRLFEDGPGPVLDQLATRFRTLRADGGAFLCTEGERGTRMFVLDEGLVDVVVAAGEDPKVVATLSPGAAFGMVSLASGAPRMSSCVARGEVLVHTLDEDGWRDLTDDTTMVGSTFRRAMIRALSDQLRHTNTQLAHALAEGDPVRVDHARLDQARKEF